MREFVDSRNQGPSPVDVKMQHVSGDVLALIVGLISKREAANLATTCQALYAKLPNQLRREVYGKQLLLGQSKQFLRCLPGIKALRSFLQTKNEIFTCYPPQQELFQLAFGTPGKKQTDFALILNQEIGRARFAVAGLLTYWAEVRWTHCISRNASAGIAHA